MVNRKSATQLQDYYDETRAKQASSVRADTADPQCADMEKLNTALQDTRERIPAQQPVRNAVPVVYQQGGPAPIGVPATLNSENIAGSLRTGGTTIVPWVVAHPLQQRQVTNPFTNWKVCL